MPFSSAYRPAPQTLPEVPSGRPPGLFDLVEPAQFPQHTLRFRHQPWAERVGLGELSTDEWLRHFGRLAPLPDNLPAPRALRYHGHQFRSYNPQLGDGRGFVLAQLCDPFGSAQRSGAPFIDSRVLDLGTKGSGRTPWSRGGDGRLTLKGGVREALATELLEALGVYTSKTLSLVETGESLVRYDEPSPTRACVLVRLSHGHLRIGTFQRLAHLGDEVGLRRLLRYAAVTYLLELAVEDATTDEALAQAFLRAVSRRVAALGADYLAAGFVHGVLNTDNINITGESFDYGPWRFLPRYDPGFVAAYFDETGLYAYGRQGDALLWNLVQLAEALGPLVSEDRARTILSSFQPRLLRLSHLRLLDRLGLCPAGPVADAALVDNALCFLRESELPFDRLFFDAYGGPLSEGRPERGPAAAFYRGARWESLRRRLLAATPQAEAAARLAAPYFGGAGPVTLVIEEVEALWRPIAESDDWSLFERKIAELRALGALLGHGAAVAVPRPQDDPDAMYGTEG